MVLTPRRTRAAITTEAVGQRGAGPSEGGGDLCRGSVWGVCEGSLCWGGVGGPCGGLCGGGSGGINGPKVASLKVKAKHLQIQQKLVQKL